MRRCDDEADNALRTAAPRPAAGAAGLRLARGGRGRWRVSHEAWLLGAILLGGLALRLWLLVHAVPALDSDEATFGLMGLHLLHGEWTPFMWGQEYMGSLEATLAAPFLWLLGPTPIAVRLEPLLIGLGFIATVYLLGRRLFTSGVGLAAAALLALGPPFFVVLSVRAYGGYVETLLLGNVLLLLALRRGRGSPHRSAAVALLFGLLAGVALWTDLLSLPFVLVAGAVVGWRMMGAGARDAGAAGVRHAPLRAIPHTPLLALGAGLLLGALPAILYNITQGGVTLTTILGLTAIGARGRHAPSISLAANVWSELTIALPILAGTAFAGTQAAGLTAADYISAAAAHPLTYAVALSLVVAALALLLAAGVSLLRRWWADRRELGASGDARKGPVDESAPRSMPPQRLPARATSKLASTPESDRQLRMAGEAALLGIAACYLVAFALSKQPDIAAAPRYLFPLYAALPVIVAQSQRVWIRAMHLRGARAPGLRGQRAHAMRPYMASLVRALPALGLAALLLWNVAGDLRLTPLQTAARDHGIWIAGSDDVLLRLLAAHHVRTVISNDYWEGLRLTYESGERVVAVMVTPEGHPGYNRYAPYVRRGLADPRPAYVELLGTPEMQQRQAQVAMGDLRGYVLVISGQFGVFLPIEGAAT